MVDVYVTLIINDRRTFEQVPTKLKADVKATLAVMGLDENGKPIVTQ